MGGRFGVSFGDASFQKGLQQTQTVALFHRRHQVVHGAGTSHRGQKIFHKRFVAIQIQQFAHHLRCLGGADFGHVDFNVVQQRFAVQERRQFIDEPVAVADLNQRAWVGKIGFEQKGFDFFGVVHGGITADAFDFFDLIHFGRGLNVFEMNIGVLRGIHNATQKEKDAFPTFKIGQQLNDFIGTDTFVVFGGDVDDNCFVEGLVVLQQHFQTFQSVFRTQSTKVLPQKFMVDLLRVDDDSFNVVDLCVVFQGALKQLRPFAELGDFGSIVVTEHGRAQNGVGDLRSTPQQIHFQQPGLQRRIRFTVGFQRF